MKCPECNGTGIISTSYITGVVANNYSCPTCEGLGELPDTPATNWCRACGLPIPEGKKYCEAHKEAERFE